LVCRVELICIGNELLIGKTLNTNAHWLSRRLTCIGCTVRRATVVRDEIKEIADSLNEALARKPDFIITTGGLGPTFDDMTLEGVGYGIDRPLEMNKEARGMLKERYLEFKREGRLKNLTWTKYRLKMARIPQGGKPIKNPVGTAPAVLIEENKTTILILPGVPMEMEAIFESFIPLLKDKSGNASYMERGLKVKGIPESEMAAMIDVVMQKHPSVYIKSHPIGLGQESCIELHLTTVNVNREIAIEEINQAFIEISNLISERGKRTQSCCEISEA